MVGIRTLYLVVYSPELYLLDHTIAMVLDDSLDIDTQNEPIYLIFNLFYCVIDLYNLPYHPPPFSQDYIFAMNFTGVICPSLLKKS